ncbi:MAG: hypothetical protein AAGJ87_09700 [Pseudomonadota bacterium]
MRRGTARAPDEGAGAATLMGHTFNSDIFLTDAAQEAARKAYPDLYFALDNETLRETFAPVDARANAFKRRARFWGVIAVLLAIVALVLAGGEMLYHDNKILARLIGGFGAVAGIVSVWIGVFGLMYKDRKVQWLSDRLITERLRQFQFQSYVARAPEIVAAMKEGPDGASRRAFDEWRAGAFDAFRTALMPNAEETLSHLVHADDPGEGVIIEDLGGEIDPEDPDFKRYLQAYAELRFDHQISYCDWVLREQKKIWPPTMKQQLHFLHTVAMGCVFGILILHAMVFIGAIAGISELKSPMVHVLAIWAAIVALGARTFEEGLQPEREIARMQQYRLSLNRIYRDFNAAKSVRAKIAAMRDLETLTYDEMVLFLRGNYEAKFVM